MQHMELEQLMVQIENKYAVEIAPLKIAGKTMRILQLTDFEQYIEDFVEHSLSEAVELPYWAKIWDATLLLAYFLGKQPVIRGQRVLEIGAGLGVAGIYAALCGHNVTISDDSQEALLFARANALLNDCPQVMARKLDWRHPDLSDQFDVIIGAEVVYDRQLYPDLVQFFCSVLKPQGIIFLAKNAQLPTPTFFSELTRHFKFKQTVQTVSTDGDSQQIVLYAIRRKSGQPSRDLTES
jgi:EEF1A lysine methyltransferase 3